MKTIDLLLALALLGLGCTSTRTEQRRSTFAFDHEGGHYEIISVVVSLEGGYNLLAQHEGASFVLQAKDYDQDGILDTLLVGGVTLDEANGIYAAGIAEAEAQGKFRVQQHARLYEWSLPEAGCSILTFQIGPDRTANKLTCVVAGARRPTVALDLEGDGVLDRIERGDGTLEESQRLYVRVLRAGIRDGRIERADRVYRVQPAPAWQRPPAIRAPGHGPAPAN